MTSTNLSSVSIGWVAIITGASAVLAIIFLTLMATVNQSFGKINDFFNSLIGISSLILAWLLVTKFQAKASTPSQIILILAVLGLIFTLIGSILIIFGFTDFVMAGWYTGIGNAFIGLWLAIFCASLLKSDLFPHNLLVFGIITGAFMAMGLLGVIGIFAKIETMETIPWYLFIVFFGYLGTYILYPIWTILLGRFLLLK